MEPHLHVEIVPRRDETPARVRIAGVDFPVAGYALEADPESGAPMLSLALAPDSVAVGRPPATAPTGRTSVPNVGRWGDGSQPDPRENFPGWVPETLGGQVAGHAESKAFGDETLRGIARGPAAQA